MRNDTSSTVRRVHQRLVSRAVASIGATALLVFLTNGVGAQTIGGVTGQVQATADVPLVATVAAQVQATIPAAVQATVGAQVQATVGAQVQALSLIHI